jgi:hypothetical protein
MFSCSELIPLETLLSYERVGIVLLQFGAGKSPVLSRFVIVSLLISAFL